MTDKTRGGRSLQLSTRTVLAAILLSLVCAVGFALPAKAAGTCYAYIGGSVYAYYYETGTTCTNGQEQITRFFNASYSTSRTVSYRGVNYFMAPRQSSFDPRDPYASRQCGSVVGVGYWCIG